MTKRALFLISDTGGGHRSAANAITAALDEIKEPFAFEHRIEDVAAHCSFPLTQLGLGYSMALRYAPPVYGALYYATNGRRRYRALVRFCEPLYRERLRDLFISYRPDVIVSVHPLLNHAALRARDDAHMQHVPVITVIGTGFALLISGVVVTESVFNLPGIGRLTVDAVLARDYPVIQAMILLTSLIYVTINLLIDVAYTLLDPRIRY